MLPQIILKAAVSLDGYLDDLSPQRRMFSNEEDKQQVDRLRASCDAILVGAGTIRADNPRLLIRSGKLRHERRLLGKPSHITKVTLSRSGRLAADAQFFQSGKGEKLVYVPSGAERALDPQIENYAQVVAVTGDPLDLRLMLEDLYRRGSRRLLVEGGAQTIRSFLQLGLADHMRLAIAPFFIGQPEAPRLADYCGDFGMELRAVHKLGSMTVMYYASARHTGSKAFPDFLP